MTTTSRPAPTTAREPDAGTDGSAPTAEAPSPRASAATAAASATLVMNGDLLWHNSFWYGAREDARRRGRSGYDFAPVLAGMRQIIAGADVAICHQEPPLAPARAGRSPTSLGSRCRRRWCRAIKATGYDVCTTASNDSVDHGFQGLKRTLEGFDRVGIAHNGTARTAREARPADHPHHP